MTAVTVTSFGYGHADAPAADIILDLRRNLRNPHRNPAMRQLTGLDETVRRHVLETPGASALINGTAALAEALHLSGLAVTVATGCVGGRHRSVVAAEEIAALLRAVGVAVRVQHRDVAKPVIQR